MVEILRAPKEHDVLPLSKPIVGVSGKVYKELNVPAGTIVALSISGHGLYAHPPNHISVGIVGVETDFRVAGIKMCGDQTPMNSDRNGGSI